VSTNDLAVFKYLRQGSTDGLDGVKDSCSGYFFVGDGFYTLWLVGDDIVESSSLDLR
jgi:hypothetical protein